MSGRGPGGAGLRKTEKEKPKCVFLGIDLDIKIKTPDGEDLPTLRECLNKRFGDEMVIVTVDNAVDVCRAQNKGVAKEKMKTCIDAAKKIQQLLSVVEYGESIRAARCVESKDKEEYNERIAIFHEMLQDPRAGSLKGKKKRSKMTVDESMVRDFWDDNQVDIDVILTNWGYRELPILVNAAYHRLVVLNPRLTFSSVVVFDYECIEAGDNAGETTRKIVVPCMGEPEYDDIHKDFDAFVRGALSAVE